MEGDSNDSDNFEGTKFSGSFNGQTIPVSINATLVGKVFVGEYIERHYVDSISTYRDVVVVNQDEIDLSRSLVQAKRMIQMTYGRRRWFGVTDNEHDRTPKGYCLWVNLSQIPFGKHWFQIESIDLRKQEIILKLKHLRSFDTVQNQIPTKELVSIEFITNFDAQKFFQELKWSEVYNFCLNWLIDVWAWCILNLKNVLTYENIRETIRFCSVLILTVISFLIEGSRFFCDYSIKLIRELSNVIHSLTPITICLIDFITRCVGGFFLLILMLFRGSRGSPISANALGAAFNRDNRGSGREVIRYTPQPQNKYYYTQSTSTWR